MSKFVSPFAKENILSQCEKKTSCQAWKAGIPHGNAHLTFIHAVLKFRVKKLHDRRGLGDFGFITLIIVGGFVPGILCDARVMYG